MEVTEVQIKLATNEEHRLLAYANVVVDNAIAIRDIRIISSGSKFIVSMPSKMLTTRCQCGVKNTLRAKYCNGCGSKCPDKVLETNRIYSDQVHPINSAARSSLENAILKAYHEAKSGRNSKPIAA